MVQNLYASLLRLLTVIESDNFEAIHKTTDSEAICIKYSTVAEATRAARKLRSICEITGYMLSIESDGMATHFFVS